MGMKHWWWRTRVSHCSNIMASLFIHEMAAIIWDSCNDFYHCNGFFNCPCNSCHQKIIFQNKEKTFKAWKNFSRLCHTAQIVLNLYNITFSKPWSRIPFTEKIKLYCKALYYSHSLSRWQLLILIFFWYYILKIIIEIKYWILLLNIEICSASIFNISGCGESINGRWILTSVNMSDIFIEWNWNTWTCTWAQHTWYVCHVDI